METIDTIALALGAGWASGINLYALLFMLGILSSTGTISLPSELLIVQHPAVLVAAGTMYFIEFIADKVPGLDLLWNSIHTFIRVPAGAVLASAALGDVAAPVELAAGLLGGTLALTSHTGKLGARVAINSSPEPFSNIVASLGEDALVIGGVWAALNYPWIFIALLVLFLAVVALLLPLLFRLFRSVFRRSRRPQSSPA
jgi:hypothetical protein